MLEKNRWYETRWKTQLERLPETERDEMLFMLAARWADDIRTVDKAESRLPWHYIDFPFKPEGEPASIQALQPPQENILTAIGVNERIVRSGSDPTKRYRSQLAVPSNRRHPPASSRRNIVLAGIPKGDEGGTDACVRVAQGRAALSLHQFWDGLITSSNNTRTLRNMAIELRNRFPRTGLTELAAADPEIWAKESYAIATKIGYQNGSLRGTPKGKRRDCREVTDATVLPNGYAAIARKIADRRMILAAYRLADLLQRISANSVP